MAFLTNIATITAAALHRWKARSQDGKCVGVKRIECTQVYAMVTQLNSESGIHFKPHFHPVAVGLAVFPRWRAATVILP